MRIKMRMGMRVEMRIWMRMRRRGGEGGKAWEKQRGAMESSLGGW